jgi:hypothetical protein
MGTETFEQFYSEHPEFTSCDANTKLLRESCPEPITVQSLEATAARLSEQLAQPKSDDEPDTEYDTDSDPEPDFEEYRKIIEFPLFNGYEIEVIFTKGISHVFYELKCGGLLGRNVGAVTVRSLREAKCFIIFPLFPNIGTIAHEAHHAIRNMLTTLRVTDHNEVFAYSLGYLVNEIVKFQRTVETQ